MKKTSKVENNFYSLLSDDECKLLNILVDDDGSSPSKLISALSVYPTYKIMFERINEKAVDFFGETILDNDDEIPQLYDGYPEELEKQYAKYSGR